MKTVSKKLLDRLSKTDASPAMRQIKQLATDFEVEVDSSAPAQSAHEVLSVWSIRLWNATLRGRRFVGLADLVRHLMALPSSKKIKQVALRNGPKVGLVFFCEGIAQPIGAVISIRSSADEQRSRSSLNMAMNLPIPVVRSASSAR